MPGTTTSNDPTAAANSGRPGPTAAPGRPSTPPSQAELARALSGDLKELYASFRVIPSERHASPIPNTSTCVLRGLIERTDSIPP